MTCTKKYALIEGPKRGGGGVNAGHSLSPPSHFMLATGLQYHLQEIDLELLKGR